MDCNSIVYDAFRGIEDAENMNVYQLEELLIELVLKKIEEYLILIKPKKTAFIAFDGVAPLAKMEQQRSRRYKNSGNTSGGWSTSNITPGTDFMKKLSKKLKNKFEKYKNDLIPGKIIISTSEEPGEGEHKLFQYIRSSPNILSNDNCGVYGLDSDLIMLALFHSQYFENIYVFREATEFIKSSVDIKTENDNECCFMDIKKLSDSIVKEMQCGIDLRSRIYDYIFLCFFLGNDFLPHFPSLNIRTHGIDMLLEIYRLYIGKFKDRCFIFESNKELKIQWKWVSLFIKELAKREHDYLLQEYNLREKWDRKPWAIENQKDVDFLTQSIPVIYRPEEGYICPSEKGWELRYYKCLFESGVSVKDVCKNYVDGLQWVFKYYTEKCPDWKWRYEHHYPPLLFDLNNYISLGVNENFIENYPVSPSVQLAYVLPLAQHNLLNLKVRDYILKNDVNLYPNKFNYKWAYCRYLWEAHVDLPKISHEKMKIWEKAFLAK
jgi:5'-3' exonuclease